MNLFAYFEQEVRKIVENLDLSEEVLNFVSKISVETPRDSSHGDLATNAAMVLAKQAKMAPRQIAELLAGELLNHPDIAAVDVAGPGFINFFYSKR